MPRSSGAIVDTQLFLRRPKAIIEGGMSQVEPV